LSPDFDKLEVTGSRPVTPTYATRTYDDSTGEVGIRKQKRYPDTVKRHVPKYRHFKAKDRGFVEYCGRRTYLPGAYQSRESVAAYRAFLNTILADLDPEEPPAVGTLAVAELVDRYLVWAAGYYGTGREYGCLYDACQPLLVLYGRVETAAFGPRALTKVRDAMVAGEIPGEDGPAWSVRRPWSRSYVNHQIARLKRLFAWGVSQELVPPSVVEALRSLSGLRKGKTVARESGRIVPVEVATVAATVAKMPPTLAAMVRLQEVTGMRSDNLCSIRPMDLDRSGPVWRYTPARHKGAWRGNGLVVFLGPQAQTILGPYLERDPAGYCFSPAEAWAQRSAARRAARKTPVQPSQLNRRAERRKRPHGARYSVETYRKAVKYACRLAGVPAWKPHQLRHNAGTTIRSRYGLEAAQVYLGHSRADVTQIYAERDLGLAEQIASEIG
jgi:integrase